MELLLESMLESVSRLIKGIEESKLVAWSKVLSGEMWSISISSTLGEVEFEEVEAVGDVAAEAAKEEGWELARSSLIGELEEEVGERGWRGGKGS